MKTFTFLAPAIFCLVICFLELLATAKGGSKLIDTVFFAFLPATFVYVGILLMQTEGEVARLRRRLGRLEDKLHRETEDRESETLVRREEGPQA
jgi:uncharacterized membrane protein YciS (DUF1049 family)